MFSTAINEADREELGGGGRGPCKERVGKGGAVSTALEQVYHGYAPGRCRPKDGLAPTGRYWIGVGGSCKVTGDKVGAVPTALVQVSHQRGTGESRPKDGLAFTGSGKVHRTDSQDPWTNPSIGHLKSLQLQPRFVEVFSFIIVDVLQSLCFMYVVSVLLLIDLRTCAFGIFDCCP